MERELDILAIGNPLVDMVAFCDEDTATLLGLHPNSNIDVSRERLNDILIALPDPSPSSGGGAANVAKLAALMGFKAAFTGCIGSGPDGKKDRFARHFENDMRASGVELHLKQSPKPSGACAVIHMAGGLISIAADPSAALDLDAEDIDEALIRRARILMLDGFLLSRTALISRILELADYYGTTVALDLSLPRIASESAGFVADMARRYPLILFMNEAEANAFSCAFKTGTSAKSCSEVPDYDVDETIDEDERYQALRSLCLDGPFPIAVVKQAEKGVLVFASSSRYAVPTRARTPFDRTGAGDAFAAGFLSSWLKGRALRDCAVRGNRIAREILTVPGSDPDREKLIKLAR